MKFQECLCCGTPRPEVGVPCPGITDSNIDPAALCDICVRSQAVQEGHPCPRLTDLSVAEFAAMLWAAVSAIKSEP